MPTNKKSGFNHLKSKKDELMNFYASYAERFNKLGFKMNFAFIKSGKSILFLSAQKSKKHRIVIELYPDSLSRTKAIEQNKIIAYAFIPDKLIKNDEIIENKKISRQLDSLIEKLERNEVIKASFINKLGTFIFHSPVCGEYYRKFDSRSSTFLIVFALLSMIQLTYLRSKRRVNLQAALLNSEPWIDGENDIMFVAVLVITIAAAALYFYKTSKNRKK